jgi:hypothetical protein
VGKNKEEVNWVGHIGLECWVNNQVEAEARPEAPSAAVCIGLQRYNAMATLLELCSAEIAEEIILGCGVSQRQGRF